MTEIVDLAAIPLIDGLASDEPAVLSAQAEPERLALLMNSARRSYTPMGMRWADERSRKWHARGSSPYAEAVIEVSGVIGGPGAFLLSYSYEWAAPRAQRRTATALR